MLKKTVFTIAAAAIVTVSAFAGSNTSAQAGNFYYEAPQPEFYVQFGHGTTDHAQRDFETCCAGIVGVGGEVWCSNGIEMKAQGPNGVSSQSGL